MNSPTPDSPEDRLLDELLREQAQGLDQEFLQQIEKAVDVEAPRAVKRQTSRASKIAIAAGVALVASSGAWWKMHERSVAPDLVSTLEQRQLDANSDRTEIVPGGFAQNKAVQRRINAGVAPKKMASISSSSAFTMPDSESSFLGEKKGAFPEITSNSGGKNSAGGGGGVGIGFGSGSGAGLGAVKAEAKMLRKVDASFGNLAGDTAAPLEFSADRNSGDRYGTFIEQPWKTPEKDPLSTFSIDVDTASYGNVRRMIREGRTIPKDAVRIEEFINAFSYHYAQPKGEEPFAVGATIATCPWAPGHQLVRVAIKGREIDANKRPASNLVFLIDVSGSMQSPDKLPLLKQSMALLVEQLDERDRVAIVVYAGHEGIALPSTRIDEEGRAAVLKALSRLDAGGSTNGGAGIKLAYDLAMKQKIEGGVNRVILATDGDFNVGVTGQQSLVQLVKDRAKGGVFLTVAGFGIGNLNDAMMDAITHDGNGNYFYIDSEREGRKVFLKNLTGTLVTIAKDVKIQVEFNPAKVGSYRLIGYANRVLRNEDFNNDKVDAGDIGAGHTVTAFYELTPPGEGSGGNSLKYQPTPAKPAASSEWLTVKLRHKHPEGDESSKIEFPLTGDASSIEKADTDFQFAAAAALFGMKLRGMEEVRDTSWKKVLELAKPGLADDASEDRAEFVELVKKLGGEVAVEPPVSLSKAGEPKKVDGPNVRVMRHEDGSRAIFTRSPDSKTLTKKTFAANGVLTMLTVYKMDASQNPLGCRIYDGQHNELFRVTYGYQKSTGLLVQEKMYDARVRRINPSNGAEMPVQLVVYLYDAEGKRSAPIIYNLLPGKTFEEVFGIKTTMLAENPFHERLVPAPAEVAPENRR